ncbi:MAG TPA: hypothetical protein VMV01_02295, partial [Planctomycetota bacterium]|nr:hypothetical protein [Planctomycetota bacterium]
MQAARRTPDAARAARRGLAGLARCLPLILVTSAAAQEGGQAPAQPAAAPAAGDEEPPAFTTEQ